MTHIDTESVIKFDYSVGAENRFVIRKWLREFVDKQNRNGSAAWESSLTETALIEGFTNDPLDQHGFVLFMKQIHESGKQIELRFPELKIGYNHFLYDVGGTMELYIDSVLSLEGTFESRVSVEDELFRFAWLKLYPRMSLQVPK